jgi:hypothetical protein
VAEEKPNKRNKFIDWFKNPNNLLALSTVILAIVTAVSAFYTKKLAEDSHTQVSSTAELVKVTQKAVNIADSSLDVSKQGMAAENAPYFVVKLGGNGPPKVGKNIKISATFKNVGKTPAIDFQTYTRVYLMPKIEINPLIIDAGILDTAIQWLNNTSVIVPSDDITEITGKSTVVNEDVLSRINYGGLVLVVRIIVKYSDIFSRKHFLVYRRNYDPNTKTFVIDENENKYLVQ